jgi:hypothetical protein
MACSWIPGDAIPACDWSRGCPVHGNGTPDARTILSTPMPDENHAHAGTIGDYLIALLVALWGKGDRFDGKRPLGESGWKSDIQKALIVAGHIPGRLDGDGYVEALDGEAADQMILSAIKSLRKEGE